MIPEYSKNIFKPIPLPGLWPVFLAKYPELIKATINKNKLTSSSLQTPLELQLGLSNATQVAKGETTRSKVLSIRGGLRIPHLHLDDKIYLLNDEQWKEFSGNVIQKIQDKLSKAKTVTYEQLMDVAESVSTILQCQEETRNADFWSLLQIIDSSVQKGSDARNKI